MPPPCCSKSSGAKAAAGNGNLNLNLSLNLDWSIHASTVGRMVAVAVLVFPVSPKVIRSTANRGAIASTTMTITTAMTMIMSMITMSITAEVATKAVGTIPITTMDAGIDAIAQAVRLKTTIAMGITDTARSIVGEGTGMPHTAIIVGGI